MYSVFMPLLQAGGEGAAAPGGLGGLGTMIPFLLIIAIFYFLIIRPQSKRQKETQKMLAALKKGDRIITIGGIHGTIQKVNEKTVIVRVDDNCKLEFLRSAISSVEPAKEKDDKEAEEAEENSNESESEETKD